MRMPKFIQKKLELYAQKRIAEHDASFMYSSQVSHVIERRAEERRKKRRKLTDDGMVNMVAEIIKKSQGPLEFKIPKGYREALAGQIIFELAKKME